MTIYEDVVITGFLANDQEIDWYKFTNNNNNVLINSCGAFLYIDLFKVNQATNKLELIRRTQNTGADCQVIILNDNAQEDFYIKVHRLNGVTSTSYRFKVRSFNYELFSRPDCDCP